MARLHQSVRIGWMAELVTHMPDKQQAKGSNPSRTFSDSILVVRKETLDLAFGFTLFNPLYVIDRYYQGLRKTVLYWANHLYMAVQAFRLEITYNSQYNRQALIIEKVISALLSYWLRKLFLTCCHQLQQYATIYEATIYEALQYYNKYNTMQ